MKVAIHFHNGSLLSGTVDKRQLFEFNNDLSSSLYVKTFHGKDTMIHRDMEIFRIEEIK